MCRAVRLRALGHLRREDGAELLLEHAARGGRAPALAALDALAAMPPSALHYARRVSLQANCSCSFTRKLSDTVVKLLHYDYGSYPLGIIKE